MQNTGRFRTILEFDREYLSNGWRYLKSERYVIDNDSSRVRWKKSGELWSTNVKVGHVSLDPPISRDNFRARGSNLMRLFHVTCREADMIIWVQLLGANPPKIWDGKKRPKFGVISDNFRIPLQISQDRITLSTSGKRRYQLQSLPRPLEGAVPLKFLHMLQNARGLLTSTWSETRVPSTSSNNKRSKIGWKFSVLAVVTLGPNEKPHETFPRDVPRGRHENIRTTFASASAFFPLLWINFTKWISFTEQWPSHRINTVITVYVVN